MLVDTNVLLHAAQPSHSLHPAAVRSLVTLMERGTRLCVTVQNLAEFWNAATRPIANNGLGLTVDEAREELSKLEGFFEILPENAASYLAWKNLIVTCRVSGVQVHDARLVAVMQAHGIASILTFDTGFSRFPDIQLVHPTLVGSAEGTAKEARLTESKPKEQ